MIDVGVAHAGHGGIDASRNSEHRVLWLTLSRLQQRTAVGTSGAWSETLTLMIKR